MFHPTQPPSTSLTPTRIPNVRTHSSISYRSARSARSATSLDLSRTRSIEPDPAAVESVAIPPENLLEDLDEEDKADPDEPNERIHSTDDRARQWPWHTKYLVLLCSFITSLSFGVTQVPLLYVFRLMTCDAYYETHPSPSLAVDGTQTAPSIWLTLLAEGTGVQTSARDRCSIHAIESSTALSISLLGASTTVFGLLNLFLTGSLIKKIGLKPTLLLNTFFPALRLLVQNIGVMVWGSTGIIIVQASQIMTIIGGPSGYMLVLNTFVTEVVEYEGRTAALGRLTGSMMFGSAAGFLLGGWLAEAFGMLAPFRLTLGLFLFAGVYVFLCLPHIPPSEITDRRASEGGNKKKGAKGLARFFGPLAVFAPKKFVLEGGEIRTEYGSFLLAWGTFLGILATGYLPTLLQLYATDVFDFGTKANGWLIFMYSMLRGVFLTFAFPKLISMGRKWTSKREDEARQAKAETGERQPLIGEDNGGMGTDAQDKPKQQAFHFDLTYARFSLVADGLLTLLCSFVREGWQMYLVAAVLPFAAGTSSAAKGTILQMVGSSATSSERTDALTGVSLVENMARLSTTFAFGVVFAGFAAIGRTELVFTCNAVSILEVETIVKCADDYYRPLRSSDFACCSLPAFLPKAVADWTRGRRCSPSCLTMPES